MIVSGFLRLFQVARITEGAAWLWRAPSGVVPLLMGGMIFVHWPVSNLFAFGAVLGLEPVLAGIGRIGLGPALKQRT